MSSNRDKFTTPVSSTSKFISSIPRSNAIKRDSLAAELERDPQLSTAKRQQRTQAFSTHMSQAAVERQLAAAQAAKLELESKVREKELVIERLEGDRRYLAEREKEEREEKEREREEYVQYKRKADSEIRSLRSALQTLREQQVDLEEENSSLARSTSQTIATQKSQISTLTHQLAEDRARAFEELQTQFDELGASQGSFIVREELHRQAAYMRQLQVTNAKLTTELNTLRERQTSVEVLKEQKRELERKVRGAEELRERVVKLEAELDASEEGERRVGTLTEPTTPSKTPVSVTQSLSALRLAHARLLEEHGSSVALLQHREQELTESQAREADAEGTIKELRAEVRSLKDRATRSEHKVSLAQREIASFNAEEAAHGEAKTGDGQTQPIQELEALVKDYKETVADLEKQLADARANPVVAEDKEGKKQLLAELELGAHKETRTREATQGGEAEMEKHLEKIEELEQTLFDLRGEIGAGRHIPPGTRVLCGARGSGGNVSGEELVPRESYEVVVKEKAKLEEELRHREKRLLRLQQVFHAKSAEFREAIAAILGGVTSQYDSMRAGGAKMTLIAQGDGGPEDLPQLMRYWIEEEQCIPCFLASVTLECYEKNKMEKARLQHA
ncbi:hypothetical protein C8Q73DRAFT_773799 [Cubamyces lactineus]|nr:hypothetical protein C8Q73DRAFT_773799 [Cubamyces lactineus]